MLLGLDIGTTRIKAVVIDAGGAEHAGVSVATPFAESADGVKMPVAELKRALQAVVAELGPDREAVSSVGLTGMAESGAPLLDGRPAAPIIAWHDERGEETVAFIPVTIAGHDHLAAAAGLGAKPDDLLNSVGTAETLLRRVDTPPDVERALELELAVTVWPGGNAWCVLASATRSGLVINALAAHLGTDPAALDELGDADAGGRDDSDDGGGAGGERRSVDLGQGIEVAAGSPASMWAATRQALVQRTAAAADRVGALVGPHHRLVVFGGGSRSRSWLAAKEAELRIPVVRCPAPEAAARGAALAAGVAAGWWSSPADGALPLSNPSTGRDDNEHR